MTVTIYHNPACGTSRNTLALIRNAGLSPAIIEYLKTPPTRATLLELAARMNAPLSAILRRKGTPFDQLGLGDPALPDAALLDAIDQYPILINRPIVATPRGVRLCRPSEVVLELLDAPQRTAFVKEDGEPVVMPVALAAAGFSDLAAALAEAGLPTTDLALPDRQFYRFADTLGETIGWGGLEGRGPDRLLRSLLVPPALRAKGFGAAIAKTLERLAGDDGAARLHLLTIYAAALFERLGYAPADRAAAPPEIAASAEFTGLCPASARYMVKAVRTSW